MTASTSPSVVRIVPDEFRLLAQVVVDGVPRVVIAIAAGEDNDAKFHELLSAGEVIFQCTRPTWRTLSVPDRFADRRRGAGTFACRDDTPVVAPGEARLESASFARGDRKSAVAAR